MQLHPIVQQSFAIIDREFGDHHFSAAEYRVVQRIIHSTGDFEFKHLTHFSQFAISQAIAALSSGTPIVTDVSMVAQGIRTMVQATFKNPIINAIAGVQTPLPGRTRSETGILQTYGQYPDAVYAIGNAPTALLSLCHQLQSASGGLPAVVIGAPVGFVSVLESKQCLAQTPVEQIRIEGRKGGSAVAAAVINALLHLAWNEQSR
ncbi:precorrin-8X methylmutase [Lyngbya confervoides]|uniref:Precorrin-8X methylmutase n=1 Tax=Lyngbya confervoides BDU141951 TaxID=1574623 RepID=A0ABD4T7M1_9CYAN|nr:precorrin-8X methylmutase [Lyngbya confervoides]MCM1984250.1 precorrin-8X methylmutase [Lyngbya confervoides BDU141951]